MTALDDTKSQAAGQIGSWLTEAALRISTGNTPGNLDGLFARHVLDGRPVTGLTWDVNPASAQWLEGNRHRLDHAPVLAALGYGLELSTAGNLAAARAALASGLTRLMRRDPFQDRLTFVNDSRQVVGLGLAAHAMSADLPALRDWLLEILADERLQAAGRFQDLLQRHVRSTLDGQPVPVEPQPPDDAAVLALIQWMATAGTARLAAPAGQFTALQQRILKAALRTDPAMLTVPQAAVIHRAVTDILDASIDQMVLSRSHIGVVLRRFEAAMRRWRWDEDDLHDPIRWPVCSEREVQDILWLILRSVFEDVVDEETLPKVGHSTYRADFGLPRLGVLVEAKYARHRTDFKKIEKEVMEDSVAYLRNAGPYKEIVVFIYDESASVQEHDMTAAALRELGNVSDVIIVSRPSPLAVPDQRPRKTHGRRAITS
ncbi:MAG: hypothetical protein ACRDNZ_15855 [Streptosporangiaceae bacterium]